MTYTKHVLCVANALRVYAEWGGGGNHIPTKGHKNPEEMFYWNYTDRERKREREGREGRREREQCMLAPVLNYGQAAKCLLHFSWGGAAGF